MNAQGARTVRYPPLLASALIAAATLSEPLHAQKTRKESEAFFADPKFVHIEIVIGMKELESLRREARKYVPVTLKVGTKEYPQVGMHVKGAAGSFRNIDDKPGLTLNMNKFGVEQTFFGMDKFHLANSVQDGSYVNEQIAGEIFRAAGVPASRITHAFVTINGRKRGFYYLKEGYDKQFVQHHFKNTQGNLYDGGFCRDIDQPLQILATKKDVKDYADLKALIAAAREPNQTLRLQKLEKLLDLDTFLDYLCIETFLWDWDGYPMNRNNYRLYHEPVRDKITFFPSGMDQVFGDPNGPLFPNFQGMIARGLMETPEGKNRYVMRMDHLLKTVCQPDALSKRLEELQARVHPALASINEGAGKNYPNEINRIRNSIKQRAKNLNEQVARELKRLAETKK